MDYVSNLNDRRSVVSSGQRSSVRQSARQSALPARQSGLPGGAARQSLISARQSLMSTRQSMLASGRLSMVSGRNSLIPSRLSAPPLSSGRIKQQREAKAQEKDVQERAKITNTKVPEFEFLELIGKGSFGRVFKSRRRDGDRSLVALKIIEVDKSDYQAGVESRESAIKDFFTEISILQTLKDAEAKNINVIHQAFNFHSQLWIVSDYCPGGSVHTLMKASKEPGLEEAYIIAIARELAIALKHIHEVGIIHRDVKAANILITEHGQVQLADFGVASALESNRSKRHTMIGTPFWMPPEMYTGNSEVAGYGKEVDCWAYGCTVYELATGVPPNFGISPHKLHLFLTKAPRLEGDKHSQALKDFVAYCLVENPSKRPSADLLNKHSFLAGTAVEYPTSMLRELLERYAIWEQSGGERASLFNPLMGAQGPEALRLRNLGDGADDDDWNFSTTDAFNEELDEKIDLVIRMESGEELPTEAEQMNNMSTEERAELELRARRGGRQMERLFDPNARPYEYNPKYVESDFEFDRDAESKEQNEVIDLDLDMPDDDGLGGPSVQVDSFSSEGGGFFIDEEEEDDGPSGQAQYHDNQEKRSTMGWTFPGEVADGEKRKTVEWTFPDSAEPSAANSRRGTQEWKFPPGEDTGTDSKRSSNRRNTMEWSFEAAEPADEQPPMEWSFDSAQAIGSARSADHSALGSPKTSVDLRSSSRPGLSHSVTAPSGDSALTAVRDRNMSLSAASDINLSMGSEPPDTVEIDPTYYSRPSTGYGSNVEDSFVSGTTSDNDDPFRYETAYSTVRKGQVAALRGNGSQDSTQEHRSSVHAHSQSEPNRGSYPGASDSGRGSNQGSMRRGQTLSAADGPPPGLNRAPSVKASMDSLHADSDDDEEDESDGNALRMAPTRRTLAGPTADSTRSSSATRTMRPNAPPALSLHSQPSRISARGVASDSTAYQSDNSAVGTGTSTIKRSGTHLSRLASSTSASTNETLGARSRGRNRSPATDERFGAVTSGGTLRPGDGIAGPNDLTRLLSQLRVGVGSAALALNQTRAQYGVSQRDYSLAPPMQGSLPPNTTSAVNVNTALGNAAAGRRAVGPATASARLR